MTNKVFAVPVFFICFRESLETAIIVSVLLAFLKQTLGQYEDPIVYKKLVRQVWLGVAGGLFVCLIIGSGMIGAFYGLQKDLFSHYEEIWEGSFALIAAIIITLMGATLLRVSKLQAKWRLKIARAIESREDPKNIAGGRFRRWCEKYAMFILPFITCLREGLEGVIFIGGVGLGLPASSFPLAVICGIAAGTLVGFFIYKGTAATSLQVCLIISTCFLYLVAAGLFSKSVWYFEQNQWIQVVGGDAAEVGSGPGSYDIHKSVWHVNCCNPEIDGGGGWGVFNSILGWQNSATYGSVIAYNVYWIFVIIMFLVMRYDEKNGHWPLMKARRSTLTEEQLADSDNGSDGVFHKDIARTAHSAHDGKVLTD